MLIHNCSKPSWDYCTLLNFALCVVGTLAKVLDHHMVLVWAIKVLTKFVCTV